MKSEAEAKFEANLRHAAVNETAHVRAGMCWHYVP